MRAKARALDQAGSDPSAHGINFLLSKALMESDAIPSFTLELKTVPLRVVLRYITEFSGTRFIVTDDAVLVMASHELGQGGLPCGNGGDWDQYSYGPPPKNALQALASAKILPQVQFADASLEEAVEHLRLAINTICEVDHPISMNVLIKPGGKRSASINLDLKDISAWDALRSVALLADHSVRADPHALVLVPRSPR